MTTVTTTRQQRQLPDFPEPSLVCRVWIQKGYEFVQDGDLCIVFAGGVGLYHFRKDDVPGRYLAAVGLVRHRGLKVVPVARALELDPGTIHRKLRRYDKSGTQGLLPGKGRRMPTKIVGGVEQRLVELANQGAGPREIARRLGLSLGGVTGALKRLAWTRPDAHAQPSLPEPPAESPAGASTETEQGEIPTQDDSIPPISCEATRTDAARDEDSPEPRPLSEDEQQEHPDTGATAVGRSASTDLNPLNRSGDRLMAHLGFLDDATPMFAPGMVPRGGVLLAVPMLLESGIFDIAKTVYGSIGPAFYGLRTSLLAFLLMALLRIKRAENLKGVSPADLGRVLGLDRAPEMKTLRRKLRELAARGKGLEFMRLLAETRAADHAKDLAYLYIDGHVRVYSGQEDLPKAYVMQRRLAMRWWPNIGAVMSLAMLQLPPRPYPGPCGAGRWVWQTLCWMSPAWLIIVPIGA